MKSYLIAEIHKTLQGEGMQAGRTCILTRLKFCNLWSGHEKDRSESVCQFCDTNFISEGDRGGRYDAISLARTVAELWDSPDRPRFVVLTGGEPMLQVDSWLINVLHRWECEVAIETNGTRAVPAEIDWVTVSPKAGAPLVQASASELKLVFPQPGAEPERFAGFVAPYRYLQPRDGDDREVNTRATVAYCLAHPTWRLSLQTHKILGMR